MQIYECILGMTTYTTRNTYYTYAIHICTCVVQLTTISGQSETIELVKRGSFTEILILYYEWVSFINSASVVLHHVLIYKTKAIDNYIE
jgi:hypothetical protein